MNQITAKQTTQSRPSTTVPAICLCVLKKVWKPSSCVFWF